jgi:hypothetical protein
MTLTPRARWLLRGAMAPGLAVIYAPLAIVLLNSFNADRTFAWPPPSLTLEWWGRAWENVGAREALWTSVRAGLGATAIAVVLGSMVAFAVGRFSFFGRNAISLLIVLPIALPGIVTGIALDSAYQAVIAPTGVQKLPSVSRAGCQSTQVPIAARIGSVIAAPMEKKLRTPCSRRLRLWSRNPWVAPAESERIRMSVPWRSASGIWAKARSRTSMWSAVVFQPARCATAQTALRRRRRENTAAGGSRRSSTSWTRVPYL